MTTIIKAETYSEIASVTNKIRFKERADGRRIMQQMHQILTLDNNNVPFKEHGEWRDVECVGPDAPDVEV